MAQGLRGMDKGFRKPKGSASFSAETGLTGCNVGFYICPHLWPLEIMGQELSSLPVAKVSCH